MLQWETFISRTPGLTGNGIGRVWQTVGSEHCTSNSYSDSQHRPVLEVK